MDEISQAIFRSIDLIVDKKLSQLQYDVTFEGEISEIVDADTGEYSVLYNGEYLSVFSQDSTKQYNVGDRVSVLIPGNELSNHKTILGVAVPESLSSKMGNVTALDTVEASPTLDNLYGYNRVKTYGVVAGAPSESDYDRYEIASYEDSDYHKTFSNYSETYEYIKIQGTFYTSLQSTHTIGNYGLEVTFYTSDDLTITYRLDLNSFNGDPYNLTIPTPQSVIFKVQKTYLTGLKSIYLFEENFDHYDYLVVDGMPSEEHPNTDTPNIFVKNIDIQYVEFKDQGAESYYLGITAVNGTVFFNNIKELSLEGRLIFQGNNIYNERRCACQWYIQDPSVTLTSDEYVKAAGVGWRALQNATSNLLTLDIHTGETWWKKTYKLIMIYNEDIILSAEKIITNLDSPYSCYIEQVNTNTGFSLQLVNNTSYGSLLGDWYVSQPDGSYLHITKDEFSSSVEVSEYLYYTSATFYCQVYDGETFVTVLSHAVTTSEFEEDLTVSYDGEDVFRYNANGDMPYEDSEMEQHLFPQITWKEGTYGTGTILQWYNVDGTELRPGSDKVKIALDKKSMIEDIRVDVNGNIFYHVRQKYKNYFVNNTLTLVVKTVDNTYTFKKEIVFVKDGDQGTNGTTYICAIRPQDDNHNKVSEYKPLVYNSGWTGSVNLRCFVYKDGTRIDTLPQYTTGDNAIEYEWTGINTSVGSGTGANFVTTGRGSVSAARYVKCQVSVDGIYIYALYPLDTMYGGLESSLVDVSELPQYIKYTSSGLNALYKNFELNATYNDVPMNISSETTSLLTIDDDGRLSPASKFIFEDETIGVLRCAVDSSRRIYHPVIMYLDTFGNEAINGWDGTSIETEEKTADGKKAHILAPQIGAGTKDRNNKFTGVVMGKDTQQTKIGLYGYKEGINTFGLMETGVAYFGKSGYGRIIMDGERASLYGGNSSTGTTIGGAPKYADDGLVINLSKRPDSSGTYPAIQIGASTRSTNYFKVDYDGKLYCKGASVNGHIEAETGYIGGWHLDGGNLKAGRVTLSSAGTITVGSNFKVNADGTLECSNARVTGIINATTGHIGYQSDQNPGWTINSNLIAGNASTRIAGGQIYSYRYYVQTQMADQTTANVGYLGQVGGNDGASNTTNIGIKSTNGNYSIILESEKNIKLDTGSGTIYLVASGISATNSLTSINTTQAAIKAKTLALGGDLQSGYSLSTTGGVYIGGNAAIKLGISTSQIATTNLTIGNGTNGSLVCTLPASAQSGIYARFA